MENTQFDRIVKSLGKDASCRGNKNFNAYCCSCQNPGQPSQQCK